MGIPQGESELKKLNIWEKTAVDKRAWIKTWISRYPKILIIVDIVNIRNK